MFPLKQPQVPITCVGTSGYRWGPKVCGVVLQAPWQSENSAALIFQATHGTGKTHGKPWQLIGNGSCKHLHRMFHILHSLECWWCVFRSGCHFQLMFPFHSRTLSDFPLFQWLWWATELNYLIAPRKNPAARMDEFWCRDTLHIHWHEFFRDCLPYESCWFAFYHLLPHNCNTIISSIRIPTE